MDIKELNSFKLSDAVKFHDKLNPKLWMGNRLDPAVKKQLLLIAKDFITELGIKDLDVEDVTISGSNAAYTYTPHSDLDLHILVDMDKLPADEVYRELFQAKKTLYNDSHDISVHGVPVELYVQDTNQPVVSLGEYSLLNDKWIKFPTKRRANLDQNATKAKYERLKELVELALQTRDIDRVSKALALIKRYRKAGLDTGGEFGPENLAYKVIRKQGGIQKLYDLRNKLHSEELTIENMYTGPKMKFLRPGELKGSYTDYDLLRMGFKKAQNGSWYIPQSKWEKLRAANLIGEETLEEKFAKEFEDYHPNAKPRGPEFPPTMPAGTVRVDVSDVYDWYKLGQHINNLKGLGKHDFGKGPPSTVMAFGSEPEEHKYIHDLEKTGLTTTDIDPVDPKQPKGMKRQKVDPTYNVGEARTNPEQNPKPESGFKELASIAKTISDPENWAISMTSEPKLGINPQVGISEDTPKGIYFYPLNYALDKTRYGKLPWGDNYPYIQLFQYDRSNEMTKQTKVDPVKLKKALLQYCPEEVIQQAIDDPEYDGTPYWFIYDCLSRLGKSDETNVVRWNKVLRDLGFTSVFDSGDGWIAYNEPTQGVVLDPKIIKQHKTITNKQKSKLVTPAVIEQAIFEVMDMELASNRAWQMYDPDGSKLRQAAKEYAKKPEFKPYYGKPGSEEIFDKAAGWGRYGARQLSQEAYEWFKEQKAQQKVDEASGYIPSAKEKNDPRFKTALTVDVKPDSIKKNAKAFSWLTSRAGIPPDARPDGKIK